MIKEKCDLQKLDLLGDNFKEAVLSKEFQDFENPLAVVLGKDNNDKLIVKGFNDLKSVLIVGATGSGKSVLNINMIMSLILKNSEEDLKLMLLDPKQVELVGFKNLPHLYNGKIYSNREECFEALDLFLQELEKRKNLFEKLNVKDIDSYNKCENVLNEKTAKLPKIILIIDEILELFFPNSNKIKDLMQKVSSEAEKFGMYIWVSAQSFMINLLTKDFSDCFNTKISFYQQTEKDSKKFIGNENAVNLKRTGEMILCDKNSQITLKVPYDSSMWDMLDKL